MASTKRKKRKPSSSLLSRRQSHAPSSISTSAAASTKPLPSKLSRRLIRSHHTTQKRLHQALQQNDTASIAALTSSITSAGGLAAYQRASVSGQSSKRGGDTSKVLVSWFLDLGISKPPSKTTSNSDDDDQDVKNIYQPRLLEIGCLSPANAIHSFFPRPYRTLMDLNSLHPEILAQDFMTFPVPVSPQPGPLAADSLKQGEEEEEEEEGGGGYDIISCSLVLNYVPTPAARGEMLKRIARFANHSLLLQRHQRHRRRTPTPAVFPALFLVLPAPCVTNSRYLTEDHLQAIMAALGYELLRRKMSPKLAYYLWRYTGPGTSETFKKVELQPGGKRNNFAIVLE
ncbi:hypothetical protein DRE_02365 [Drechslerella stenobrocha 248]|uniref:25S rRNA adenine-N(1) methyltransferase n=1 Tax=Drechslerella stenobrocha 248 TaxID=1043628 RepID=W7HVP1_9PEZI|nr:hypothetical protein DRE_02365 [Drechslerella stenobrocha 248]